MNNLELAYAKWGDDSSLKAKRNIAYAELVACNVRFDSSIRWQQINFTESLYKTKWETTHQLTSSCIRALNDWLEGIWALHNQTTMPLYNGIFFNNIDPKKCENDIELEIQKLDMRPFEEDEIRNLYIDYAQRKAREGKDILKKQREKTAQENKVWEAIQSNAKQSLNVLNKEFIEQPSAQPVEKTTPEWWKQSVKKYENRRKEYPMPEYLYRRRDKHWIEQKILDYGCVPVLSRLG